MSGVELMAMGTMAAEAAAAEAAAATAATAAGAGALGAGATTAATMGPQMMGLLGGMGSEQAAILAAQNAGLGLGADWATLQAAGTAGGGAATPFGIGQTMMSKAGEMGKAAQMAQMMGGDQEQQQPMPQRPTMPPQENPSFGQIQQQYGAPQMPANGLLGAGDPQEEKRLALLKQMGILG